MRIEYSKPAKDGLDRHADYLRELKKSDPKKYDHISVKQANDTLRHNIIHAIDDKDEHESSIFPDKYEYGHSNYKMHIDKESHYVVFYKIIKAKSGKEYISIQKCEHSNVIRKELEEKNIKPLKSADPKLLLDYTTIEKEDKVKADELSDQEREDYKKKEEELKDRIEAKNKKKSKSKSKSSDKEDEEEMINTKTGEKVKVTPAPDGPRGGKRVKVNGKLDYASNYEKDESKLISLSDYITENTSFISLADYMKQYLA